MEMPPGLLERLMDLKAWAPGRMSVQDFAHASFYLCEEWGLESGAEKVAACLRLDE